MNENNTKQTETKKKKLRLNALDVMLILVLVICIGAFGLKYIRNRETAVSTAEAMEEYIVSFKVSNIRSSSVDYFHPGDIFYTMDDKGKNIIKLGELRLRGSDGEQPAQTYYTKLDGTSILVTNSSDLQDSTSRIDLTGDLVVKGIMRDTGFYVGEDSNTYLGINKELEIKSKYIAVTVTIMGISKASEKVNNG